VMSIADFDVRYRFVPKDQLVRLDADVGSFEVREQLTRAVACGFGTFRVVGLAVPEFDGEMSAELRARLDAGFWVVEEGDVLYDRTFVAVLFEPKCLVFVPFGRDGVAGDSGFFPSSEDLGSVYREGMSFEEMLAVPAYLQGDGVPLTPEEVAGFWVLERDKLETMLGVCPDDLDDDGAVYAANCGLKTGIAHAAVRIVERPV